MNNRLQFIGNFTLLTVLLTACTSSSTLQPTSIALPVLSTLAPTALMPTAPTPASTPSSNTPVGGQQGIWVSPAIPQAISKQIIDGSQLQPAPDKTNAACSVEPGNQNLAGNWVYALVAPFNTVTDDVDKNAFLQKWKNHAAEFPAQVFLVDQESKDFLTAILGDPDPSSIQITPDEHLLENSWKNANTWAIIPFDLLQPEWKVISISKISPLFKQFDPTGYELSIPFSLNCPGHADITTRITASPITNRDAKSLTTLVLTGTTAMVRGTAYLMETKGVDYPATDIVDILKGADFTHVSNEIPYWPSCPKPFINPGESKLVFCSDPQNNQLLADIGTDIVELSGDHFNDWGPAATLYTIDMYKKLGWGYYGGGVNLEDGRKPLLLEHNGNKIAFLGCNAKPPGYGTASATRPGAVHCNFDDLDARIKAVKEQGYIPIVTFQHLEYYAYTINPILQADFRNVADAGAAIVSGSQAHQPQGIEFYKGSFLHYGLGNLFFDQYKEGLPTRQAFIDRYVFYKGKYISTELITIMFTDLAHSRLMTPPERLDLLQTIFKVSIWPFNN